MADNYTKLAKIYDFVMKRVRYDRWSEYLYLITNEYVPENPRILELAAGKCAFTSLFSEYYENIIATDLSFEMLSSGYFSGKKICCNMGSIPFKTKFDLIYSTFDSINYLLTKKQLLKMLTEVSRILSDDGIFTFDCSMEKNSLIHTQEPIRRGKYNGYSYVHKSSYNSVNRVHTNTFEIADSSGKKHKEIHKQKIYSFETYFDIIPKSGLYVAACYKAFAFIKGNNNSERLQFILKKAGVNVVV